MAISMSGATVNTEARDALLSSEIDQSITSGGAEANTQATGFLGLGGREATGAALAGVTQSFATNVSNEIDTYKSEVQGYLDKLTEAESNVAFKGEAIKASLTKFITSVRNVAKSYLDKLEAAEKQIVDSVKTAYQTQDTDLSQNLDSDSGSLESNTVN